jgi:hypothetical protein
MMEDISHDSSGAKIFEFEKCPDMDEDLSSESEDDVHAGNGFNEQINSGNQDEQENKEIDHQDESDSANKGDVLFF